MSSLMFSCCFPEVSMIFLAVIAFFVNGLWTDGRTDGPTDGRTDGRTDKASYRDAWTHLKIDSTPTPSYRPL